MKVTIKSSPGIDWDAYVSRQTGYHPYARSGWAALARDVFGQEVYFLRATSAAGDLCGVMPLVRQKSAIFGDFMTSIPYFSYGGAVADTPLAAQELMAAACDLAQALGCKYVEFRDVLPCAGPWSTRTDKVSMILELPQTLEELGKRVGAKLRSQVRRAEREFPSVATGGLELLDDFYSVFSRNMRDLGTPVYPKRFFATILERFPAECFVVVVRRGALPAAAGFIKLTGKWAEIPWAACVSDAKPLGFNMKLYWEVLSQAIARGCTHFDFGRSTIGSGTYRFKAQWCATPLQLHWHRWEQDPTPPNPTRARGRLVSHAIVAWKRLPLPVANWIGPLISPGLPW